MSNVTRLLERFDQGDTRAAEELLPLVYEELRRLAAARLARERPGQTLDATALVHEAYLRLTGGSEPARWNGRGHFFGAAAAAMRRILVENARRKGAERHGGNRRRFELAAVDVATAAEPDLVLAIDNALERLALAHPEAARLVELRFYTGLTLDEAAEALGISPATVRRRWAFARAWLQRALESESAAPVDSNPDSEIT
jgi:RNA polymerase sigma factor (TIGR02999 family)